MATVDQFINSSFRLINVLDPGETPSASETADAFSALNQILSSWSAAGVPVPRVSRDVFALSGAASYPIASVTATRPLRIRSAAVVAGGVHSDVKICTAEEWTKVADKTRTGKFARFLFYDGGYPTGTIYLTPTPGTGSSLEMYTVKPLTAFATTAETIDLPPGYEHALRFALAMVLAAEYGAPITPALSEGAAEAKTVIAKLNVDVLGGGGQPVVVPAAV